MSLIAAANPAWKQVRAAVQGATQRGGPLEGATFYEGSVVPVNLRFPAIVVTERSVSAVEQTYSWGVAQLRIRMNVLSEVPDPAQNLEQLEGLSDALLDLFWNDRKLGGTVRDTIIDEITIGGVEERPEHISATLVLTFNVEFQRPN